MPAKFPRRLTAHPARRPPRTPALDAEREHRRRPPAALVEVSCPRCGDLLGEVVSGAEAFCPACAVWVPSVGVAG